ncbi:uncharacterized protein LOC121726157 [Aricia agestis]|uniref:uncharacterized protein LOC121726157 n=1 Tax=Aricia agestis TaxID=91739 RepID=UPI001C202EC8|nr:uncharacterized protein LOC121726157 [Aricia agestis]
MPPKKDDKHETEDEEEIECEVTISFKDLEKSMTIFTGDDTYPIETFIDEFEDTAQIMKWTKVEKLIYAKRLLDGTAKLFLRSLGRVKDYSSLKKALKEEFGPKINSAVVHKKLASRKMKNDETYQQYFLSMKELALHGKVEDAALIEYVIDGIRDLDTNKGILYGASDIKEFRKKLEIYSEFRKKISNKPANFTSDVQPSRNTSFGKKNRVHRCYNCGDVDHVSSNCSKGVKCFKCNDFGHKATECSKPAKTLNIQSKNDDEKVPYKKIKINGQDALALIDTGSDINLITKSQFEKIKENVKDYKNKTTCITGIAKNEVYTEVEENDEDDADKQMGETDNAAEKLDQQIWGSEDEEDLEEQNKKGKEERGTGESTGGKKMGVKEQEKRTVDGSDDTDGETETENLFDIDIMKDNIPEEQDDKNEEDKEKDNKIGLEVSSDEEDRGDNTEQQDNENQEAEGGPEKESKDKAEIEDEEAARISDDLAEVTLVRCE